MKIKMRLFDYCAGVPDKLLALIVPMTRWLYNKIHNVPNPSQGGVFAIEGSRGSSKSQSLQRIVGQLLECNYAQKITIGIITEAALDESVVSLFDEIFENQISEPDSKIKYRKLKSGQEIFFKGFHPSKKTALKGTERATDILLIDEVEDWGIEAAAKTLNTYLRAGGIIILLSNRFSHDILAWVKSVGGEYRRIDYWENPHLDARTRESWDRLRQEDPEYWRATVLYQADSDNLARLYSNIDIDRAFGGESPHPVGTALVRAIGQDFAVGGKDKNVSTRGIKDDSGIYHLWVGKGNTFSTDNLLAAIMAERNSFKSDIFCGDAVGQGLPIMQLLGPESKTLLYFKGNDEGDDYYSNLRAATFGRVKELASKHLLVIHCDSYTQARIREDMRAIILAAPDKRNRIRIQPKEKIRTTLGRSTDYIDSIAMCVYALDQGVVYDNNYTGEIRSLDNSFDSASFDW